MSLIQLRLNIKAFRKAKGYTAETLSKMLGKKHHQIISHWESGFSIPQTIDLLLLSNLYDISINDLVRSDLIPIAFAEWRDKLISETSLSRSELMYRIPKQNKWLNHTELFTYYKNTINF